MTTLRRHTVLATPLALLAIGGCNLDEIWSEDRNGCDKVDILFVIDNSGSMGDNQANLIRNFPRFAQSIESRLGSDIDYHVAVVSTDAYSHNPKGCRKLGALVSHTVGNDGALRQCFAATAPGRFLTGKDNVGEQFSCIANIGTDGSAHEDPIGAARAALAQVGTGACNDDFLRGDSLLVLAFLTDEDALTYNDWENGWNNAQTYGEALELIEVGLGNAPPNRFTTKWVLGLAQASGHHPDNTVVVSLTTGVPGSVCQSEVEAPKLVDFTNSYKYHHLVDICAESYGDPLRAALEPVDNACTSYEPRLEVEHEAECVEGKPSHRAWFVMVAATLASTLVSAAVLLFTLAPSLAKDGRTQSRSNIAAYSSAMLLGGAIGTLLSWSYGCGLWGAFGIVPAVYALVGAVLLLASLLGGTR